MSMWRNDPPLRVRRLLNVVADLQPGTVVHDLFGAELTVVSTQGTNVVAKAVVSGMTRKLSGERIKEVAERL